MKKLVFLTHINSRRRFRVGEFIPFFERNGVSVKTLEVPNGPLARLKTFCALGDSDVIVIKRKLLNALDLSIIRRRAKRITYDFDDAVMYRSSSHKDQNSWDRMRRFASMIRSVDAVTAGNTYLAEQAARFISPDRIFIVPTIVDVTEYGIKDYAKESDDFVVGWIGSASTLHYLAAIAPAVRRAAHRVKNLKLKIVCNTFIDIDGVTVIKKPWRAQDVSEDLKSFDVGIMPIPDDPWTRGKCGFKVVQYLAAGVAAIASPVGVNRDLVIPGETGLLADNFDDWEKRLIELAENKELRMRMGRAGRRLIEEHFSLQTMAPRYLKILETVEKMNRRRS
jgi:glycosyltransferase involved in cell wall biosynthesis